MSDDLLKPIRKLKIVLCLSSLLLGVVLMVYGVYLLVIDKHDSPLTHFGILMITFGFFINSLGCELLGEIRMHRSLKEKSQ